MKTLRLLAITLLAAACGTTPLTAQESAGTKDPAAKDAPQLPAVPASLKKIKFLKGKPNLKAKYFIYLYSASGCVHCANAMPTIVGCYPKLKADKVEIILLCGDSSDAEVLNYVKKFKIKFPAVQMNSDEAKKAHGYLPALALPWVILYTDKGQTLFHGHPDDVFPKQQWKGMIADYEKNVKAAAAKAAAEKAEGEEQ